MPRKHHDRGDFLTGAAFPASSKPVAEAGRFVVGGPIAKRAPLPADLRESFQEVVDYADRLGASRNYLEIEKWAREARAQLAELEKRVRK